MRIRTRAVTGTVITIAMIVGLAGAPAASALPANVIDGSRSAQASHPTVSPSAKRPPWRVRMLALVNAERAKVGVAPLVLCAALNRASQKYAKQMSLTGHFDHIAPDGTDPADRGTAEGYQIQSYGENIAAGQTNVRRVMNGWVHSPGHYANIISDHFTHLGLGHALSAKTRYSQYWVQNFGTGGPC
ncbi:MAG: CAP domain-containing protein [bacterium]|nr:CAP domain-containing protein [bacterium]